MKPFVIKNLLQDQLFNKLREHCEGLKKSQLIKKDNDFLGRDILKNDPHLFTLHHKLLTPLAIKFFKEDLVPTYNFLSLYRRGQGNLPLHVDNEECYQTIDICLSQKEIWPLYINHKDLLKENEVLDVLSLSDDEKRYFENNSTSYNLEPGDAIFYSGTECPHWRHPIQEDNFCDMALFHFKRPA
jgi:alkylated DNA repair dioxygenase AlkB